MPFGQIKRDAINAQAEVAPNKNDPSLLEMLRSSLWEIWQHDITLRSAKIRARNTLAKLEQIKCGKK